MYATCRINWKTMLLSLLISLGTGGLSALLTGQAMRQYGSIRRPPLSPPASVFPIVWTVLFILMAVSAYLVYESGCGEKKTRLLLTQFSLCSTSSGRSFFSTAVPIFPH